MPTAARANDAPVLLVTRVGFDDRHHSCAFNHSLVLGAVKAGVEREVRTRHVNAETLEQVNQVGHGGGQELRIIDVDCLVDKRRQNVAGIVGYVDDLSFSLVLVAGVADTVPPFFSDGFNTIAMVGKELQEIVVT